MTGNANLIKQTVKLADNGRNLRSEITGIHDRGMKRRMDERKVLRGSEGVCVPAIDGWGETQYVGHSAAGPG